MKPWLLLPSEWAHKLSPYGLKIYSFFKSAPQIEWQPFQFKNLYFKNRLGIAGGVDKTGTQLLDWQNMGCGFVEVGTVTLRAQEPNPGKIMDRHLATKSLWNKMGFPSPGADIVHRQLQAIKKDLSVPLFINIGKNRDTANEKAHEDYIQLLKVFHTLADAFVINISSPNTKGLRDLTNQNYLQQFLQSMGQYLSKLDQPKPLFLKLSPDLSEVDLIQTLNQMNLPWIDGFILTNTTTDRTEALKHYPTEGGVSGLPLKERALKALKVTKNEIEKWNLSNSSKKMIISVGGVMTEDDVFERIKEGADLVQIFTALIYTGPAFFRKVHHFVRSRESKDRSFQTNPSTS